MEEHFRAQFPSGFLLQKMLSKMINYHVKKFWNIWKGVKSFE